jgi:hypothetical protein
MPPAKIAEPVPVLVLAVELFIVSTPVVETAKTVVLPIVVVPDVFDKFTINDI